jgi:hypothetical protein
MELMAVSLLIAVCGLDVLTLDTVRPLPNRWYEEYPQSQYEISDRQRGGIGCDLSN